MVIRETEDFRKDLEDLPSGIRRLFQRQKTIFRENWLDPRLHIKRNKELPGVYSFRITRRYKVFFYFRNDEVIFFKIGHRKDIYK